MHWKETNKMSIRSSTRKNKGQNKYLEEILRDEDSYYILNNSDNVISSNKEIVKCIVCQTTDENYDELTDTGGDMIQCDKCDTWQHIKCMTGGHDDINPFLTSDKKYFCSICSPETYPHLVIYNNFKFNQNLNNEGTNVNSLNNLNNLDNLEILNNNDVFDNDDNYQEIQDEEKFDDHNVMDNDDYETISTTHKLDIDDFIDDDTTNTTKKRKTLRDESKGQKKKLNDSNETKIRDNAFKMFNNLFLKFIIPEVTNLEKYSLPQDKNIEEISKLLAQELEIEIFKTNSDPTTLNIDKYYTERVRSLYSNLKDKKNFELKCHVLNKQIPFEKLVRMTSNELANPDLQNFKQKVNTELLTQLVVDLPEKPLYVKTHKGEELIDSNFEEQQEDSLYSMNNIHRLSIDEQKAAENDISSVNDERIPENKQNNAMHDASEYSEKLADVLKSMKQLEDGNKKIVNVHQDSQNIEQTYNENDNSQDNNSLSIESSIPIFNDRSTFMINSNILYPEFNIKFNSKLNYITCTKRKVKNPYREALDDGALIVEGRLAVDKAYSYLKQIKDNRNILLYYMSVPEFKKDADGFNNLSDSIILNNKALGVSVKQSYEKNIYIVAADSGEYPSIIEELYDINTRNFQIVKFSEQKIFVLVVVKTELIK